MERQETLCWHCKYSALGDKSPCEWAREFKPVDGWDAEQTHINYTIRSDPRRIDSYCVNSCPKFERGSDES